MNGDGTSFYKPEKNPRFEEKNLKKEIHKPMREVALIALRN